MLEKEIVLNILLYMPLGFILPAIFRKVKLWKLILVCLLLCSAIEMVQLVAKIGLFEFDDIFDNTLGGILGMVCYQSMQRWKKRIK